MKVLALAASSSRQSINKQLANYAAGLLTDAEIELLDINDYEMALYSSDREEESGIPQLAHDFREKIAQADAVVIAFAEHNGSYTAAFKNLFDWTSRIDMKVYQSKPMVMLATSFEAIDRVEIEAEIAPPLHKKTGHLREIVPD